MFETPLRSFEVFEPVTYTSQVVAGKNYAIKIKVAEGKFVTAKIHTPLPHTQNPPVVLSAAFEQ